MISTQARSRQSLIEEIDRRNTYVRELLQRVIDAKRDENYDLARQLTRELKREEKARGLAYERYVSGRPEIVDLPESELRERQNAV